MSNATSLPADLPIPEDDGACDHLPGSTVPDVQLATTTGELVSLATLPGMNIVFCYPRTAGPGESVSDDWNAIPGARGCTPESCAFRDLHREFQALNVGVYGLSTQSGEQQAEAKERLHLPHPLLSDRHLGLASAMRLPTFHWRDMTCIRRLTLVIRDGAVEHVIYPVFPPDTHPDTVLSWIRDRRA